MTMTATAAPATGLAFWRVVFGLAALFNLAVGIGMAAGIGALPGEPPLPREVFVTEVAGLLIAVFGLGYILAARNPTAHRGIILLGAIGKSAMPFISGLHFLRGEIPASALALSFVDLLFVILFVIFLVRTR
jgi:hypothetical protein